MSRTHGGASARRATALLTVLLFGGSGLTGCTTEGSSDDGATPSPSSGTSSAPASPSPQPTAEAGPAPSEETGPEPTEEPSDGVREPGGEKDQRDDDGHGDDGDGEHTDDSSDGASADTDPEPDEQPELPAYIAFGEHSERVESVQQQLQDLGYYITAVDGAYGGETQQALWALQKAAGLYRDGVVGPRTQEALDNRVTPRPRSSSGKVIEIDIARQLVLAVEDGRVVRTINAASGNGERFEAQGRVYMASTPRGDFSVYNQIDGMHSSTLELGDMWRPKYFNGSIALHGSGSVPPVPASHGCVRVSNAAMNWIWDVWGAPPGTRVQVY